MPPLKGQGISKTIVIMSFKLRQLIEDNENITRRKVKNYISFKFLHFANLDFENLKSR